MEDDTITTVNRKYVCSECQNELQVEGNHKPGDVIECEFCGLEYEIVEKKDDAEYVLRIIEEEK